MTRFVVDCATALRLASEEFEVAPGHEVARAARGLVRTATIGALRKP